MKTLAVWRPYIVDVLEATQALCIAVYGGAVQTPAEYHSWVFFAGLGSIFLTVLLQHLPQDSPPAAPSLPNS